MLLRQQMQAASVRDLRELLARLRGGSIGFDPNRHPICSKKPGLIDYILANGNPDESAPPTGAVLDLLREITNGEAPAPAPAPSPKPAASLFPPDTQQKEAAPMPAATNDATAQQLAALLAQLTSRAGVDPDQVREIVRAELDDRPPHRIEVVTPDATKRAEGYRHPMFEKVLRLAGAGLNVMMTGPAGSGKTTLAAQVAEALGRPFGMISLTAGASESQLLGRFLPTGEAGRFEYTDTPFIRAYEDGGVFLLDEFDAADPNLAIVLNAATSGNSFFNDYRTHAPEIRKHADAVILAACNTYGTGADVIYSGRNQLDAATLDRFYTVRIDYDPALDRNIAGMAPAAATRWKAAGNATTEDLQELGAWVLAVREKIAASGLRRVFSPRATAKATAARRAGIPTAEVKADLLAGWTRDELAKIGSLAP